MTSRDFENKVAVITGASSGLGQATAILFATKGASIVLCGRDKGRLEASVKLCVEASGGNTERFVFVSGDITESEVRKSIIDKTIEKFKKMDILVANAGVMYPDDGITVATEASFDASFDTNVKAVFFMIQAAIPHLEASRGNVISVSSVLSTMVPKSRAVYPMCKAAVDHMTRCLALDLGPRGIRVNAVNPSYVKTRMRRNFGDNYEELATKTAEIEDQKHPLNAKCIAGEDIANTIAFLASDAAKSITGQCHIVDNGRNFTAGI